MGNVCSLISLTCWKGTKFTVELEKIHLRLSGGSESPSVVSDSQQSHDYTIHEILQARILEWVAFPFSRGSSQPKDRNRSPALQVNSLPVESPRKPRWKIEKTKNKQTNKKHLISTASNYGITRLNKGYNKQVDSKHSFPIIQENTLHMDITRWSIVKSD